VGSDLTELFSAKSAKLADVDNEGRLLVQSNLTGTMQLYEWQDGELTQLTNFDEPVTGQYLPGTRRAVVSIDSGGNERGQLFLLDLDSEVVSDVSDLDALAVNPSAMHSFAGATADGKLVAYVSNARNGVDFDAYLVDIATGEQRCIYQAGGYVHPSSGFSPDGRYLALGRAGERPLDADLLLVDTDSGTVQVVLDHPGQSALVGDPSFVHSDSLLVSSSVDRDFAAILRYEISTATAEVLLECEHDLEVAASADGTIFVAIENHGGATRAQIYDARTAEPLGELPMPGQGVIAFAMACGPVRLTSDGSEVYFTFSSPTTPGDLWRYRRAEDRLTRLTTSPFEIAPERLALPEAGEVTSFDGVKVPLFSYRPPEVPTGAPLPVVVLVHGGPEGQSVLNFNPVIQALVLAGYAVVVPNVRGSTGYGKTYASLDDTTKRLDSVKDLEAIHRWLASAGFDPERAALWGGSYGGYMVLAGCAFQPELWAAGVDIVGISDLVTFLENTSSYRRAVREREYGSLEHDRSFLESASPLRRVDAMRAPLFVIHGANDPRVPLSEAEQLVSSLEARGVPCELSVYYDEGHGLAKLANRLDAYPKAIAFLSRVLHPASPG